MPPAKTTDLTDAKAVALAVANPSLIRRPLIEHADGSVTVTVGSAAGTPSGDVTLSVDGQAAVTQTWSNGPVEGHVNRLKTIKRQMYGRAAFVLLRARVLNAA